MIQRLREVLPGKIFRGSAPSPKDVLWLKDTLGINKIVSLDKNTGEKIDRACKMLGIDHVKMYIDEDRASLVKLLKHNLKDLLMKGGPTYIHCLHGKDRTGLVSALFKCKYMGMDPEKAIEEAKSLGFGIGLYPSTVHFFEKLIRACKPEKDTNDADIVSNEREYVGDNRDSFLDESRRRSFEPYLDHTRQNPADALYVYINDQSPTRQNYQKDWKEEKEKAITEHDEETTDLPMVGQYDNDAGQRGFGPTENYNGFYSEIGH